MQTPLRLACAFLCAAIAFGFMTAQKDESPAPAPTSPDWIEVEAVIEASIDDVWKAWTTSEGIAASFGAKSKIDLSIGGAYEIYFHPDAPEGERGSETCKVLSYLPHEMLSFSWNAPVELKVARKNHTWVVLRFEELGPKSVRVRLTHLGFEEQKKAHPEAAKEFDEARTFFTGAWAFFMQATAASVETSDK